MSVHARYVGHRPNPVAIQHVFRDKDGPVGRELDRASLLVLNRARALVGARSGRLLGSLRREDGIGPTGRYVDVIAGSRGLTPYLGAHMFGTHPHVIRPRRRTTLRFVSHGRVVYARRVSHPGAQANPFLTRALDAL